ncbi:MAG: type VI secretion system baseplate subunit TssG [Pseudomonadota bacterium]
MKEGTFAHLCARPEDFDAITALRLAEATANATARKLVIVSEPTSALRPVAISRVEESDAAITLTAHLFGLTGPLSPLPPAYTEIAAQSHRRRQHGLSSFLDLFAARLTLLFADAAEKYRLANLMQWRADATSRLLHMLSALIGFGTPGTWERVPEPEQLLRFAGLLANTTRSAEGLRAMLSTFLDLPVEIEQFHPRWVDVPADEQTCMDGNAILGQTTMAGAKARDLAGKIRIVIGPVRRADFASLEPGQPRLAELERLTRLYIGPVLEFDTQIVLHREDVPDCQIGGLGPLPRLGWNVWAKSAPLVDHSRDAILQPAEAP